MLKREVNFYDWERGEREFSRDQVVREADSWQDAALNVEHCWAYIIAVKIVHSTIKVWSNSKFYITRQCKHRRRYRLDSMLIGTGTTHRANSLKNDKNERLKENADGQTRGDDVRRSECCSFLEKPKWFKSSLLNLADRQKLVKKIEGVESQRSTKEQLVSTPSAPSGHYPPAWRMQLLLVKRECIEQRQSN